MISDLSILLQTDGQQPMFFGYEFIDGIKIVFPEKALIDCLYYYQLGKRYYFSIFDDVNVNILDQERFFTFLTKYKKLKDKILSMVIRCKCKKHLPIEIEKIIKTNKENPSDSATAAQEI